jgi:uncharacterized protein (DUF2062 family)
MQQPFAPSTEIRPVLFALVRGGGKSVAEFLRSAAPLNLPVILVASGIAPSANPGELADKRWLEISSEEFSAHGRPGIYLLSDAEPESVLLERALCASRNAGFSHALVIPADTSYPAEQIPHVLTFCARHPRAIVQGRRSRKSRQTSTSTQLGMSMAQRLLLLESGVSVDDGICGLRVYPLIEIEKIKCSARSVGHPMELLARAARSGVAIMQIAVTFHGGGDSSKATLADWTNAGVVHTKLLVTEIPRWPGHLAHWLSPFRAWRELRKAHTARSEFARGLAIGVFIACLPAYGVQSFLGLFAARRLNLNPLSVLTGTQLSWPPITPILIFLSVGIGHLLLHGSLPRIEGWTELKASMMSAVTVKMWIGDWILGGFLLGLVLGILTYVGSLAMFRLMPTPEGS